MDRDLFNCREDNECIRVHLLRENLCCEILVDDSRSAFQMVAFGLEYRNTAASAGNDNMIRLN